MGVVLRGSGIPVLGVALCGRGIAVLGIAWQCARVVVWLWEMSVPRGDFVALAGCAQ
jgi:hypothetical protein